MKNCLIVFVLSLAVPMLASAQGNSKLEQAVSVNAISATQAKDLSQVKYLEFKANSCFYTQDLSGKKDVSDQTDITALNELKVSPQVEDINGANFDKATFNPLLYKTDQIKNMAYYRIGDTGVLMQLYSEEYCQSMFKK